MPSTMHRALTLATRAGALALAFAPVASADEAAPGPHGRPVRFGLEARWWFLGIDGDLRVTDTDASGTAVKGTFLELTDEYDLDRSQGTPELVARLDFGRFGAIASYMEIGADGNPTLRRDIAFDGKIYNAGDYLSTLLELRYVRGMFEWNLFNNSRFAAGITFGAAYFRFDAEVTRETGTPPGPIASHETGRSTLPLVGFTGRLSPISWLMFRGDIAGFVGAYKDFRGACLDTAAGAYLVPHPNVALGCGLRLLHVDIGRFDLGGRARGEGRFTLYGVFMALELRI